MRELWLMTAMICRTIAQVNGVSNAKLEDFMPTASRAQEPLTAEGLLAKFRAILPPSEDDDG